MSAMRAPPAFVCAVLGTAPKLFNELRQIALCIILIMAFAILFVLGVVIVTNLAVFAGLLGLVWLALVAFSLILYIAKPPYHVRSVRRFLVVSLFPELRKYTAYFPVHRLCRAWLDASGHFSDRFNWGGMEDSKYFLGALHGYEWLAVETYRRVEVINEAAWYRWNAGNTICCDRKLAAQKAVDFSVWQPAKVCPIGHYDYFGGCMFFCSVNRGFCCNEISAKRCI